MAVVNAPLGLFATACELIGEEMSVQDMSPADVSGGPSGVKPVGGSDIALSATRTALRARGKCAVWLSGSRAFTARLRLITCAKVAIRPLP